VHVTLHVLVQQEGGTWFHFVVESHKTKHEARQDLFSLVLVDCLKAFPLRQLMKLPGPQQLILYFLLDRMLLFSPSLLMDQVFQAYKVVCNNKYIHINNM
jgi:hypothetical protein